MEDEIELKRKVLRARLLGLPLHLSEEEIKEAINKRKISEKNKRR